MAVTMANGYSSESTRRELSNEYQQDRVPMVFKRNCVLVLWTKVATSSVRVKCQLYRNISFIIHASLRNTSWKRPVVILCVLGYFNLNAIETPMFIKE